MIDLVGGVVAFLLTIVVLSYLFFGTHGLFRLVVYLFVGVTAGYVGAVAWLVRLDCGEQTAIIVTRGLL